MGPNNGAHILLIDDDEVDIEGTLREFNKVNSLIQVSVANSGLDALDKLYGRNNQQKLNPPPQVILLDINMPKMDGIEFLRVIRQDPEFNQMNVFLLTGAFSTKDKLATRELNVSGYIVKPLEYADALHIFWRLMDESP